MMNKRYLFFILLALLLIVGFLIKNETGKSTGNSIFDDLNGNFYDSGFLDVSATNPDTLSYGDMVSINATIKNFGELNDSFEVMFVSDLSGAVERRLVDLNAGATTKEKFSFKAEAGKRFYQLLIVSINDKNLSNNIFNYTTNIRSDIDVSGQIQVNPSQENFIVSYSKIYVNITNEGKKNLSDINYSIYLIDLKNSAEPTTFSNTIPKLDSGEQYINYPKFNFIANENYILMLVVNYSGDEFLSNNIFTQNIKARNSGADLQVLSNISVDNYKDNYVFLGNESKVSFKIKNIGDGDSGSVDLMLYDYDPECFNEGIFNDDDCIISELSRKSLVNIPAYSTSEVSFDYIGNNEGLAILELKATSAQDVYSKNNWNLFPIIVKQPGIDLAINVAPGQEFKEFVANETNELNVIVSNIGNSPAHNIIVSLYNEIWDNKEYTVNFLSSVNIPELDSLTYGSVRIPFEINTYDYKSFMVNVSSDENDVDPSSNSKYFGLQMLDDNYNLDIFIVPVEEIENDYVSGNLIYPIVGRNYTIKSTITNNGKSAENVNIKYYADGNYIGEDYLDKIYYNIGGYSQINWIPSSAKNYKIEAKIFLGEELLASGTEQIIAYNPGQYLSFNITDENGIPTKRYVKSSSFLSRPSDTFGMVSNEFYIENPQSFEVNDPSNIKFEVIKYFNDSYLGAPNLSVRYSFDVKNLKENLNMISGYYPRINDNGRDLYYVYANKILSKHGSQLNGGYSLITDKASFENSGLESLNGSYGVFYCTDFNFIDKKCNKEWGYVNYMNKRDLNTYDIFSSKITDRVNMNSDNAPGLINIYYQYYDYKNIDAFAISKTETFNGMSSKLGPYSNDVDDQFTLEKWPYGKIEFLDLVNVSRFKENNGPLDYYVFIKNNFIGIDSEKLPELNKKAKLTFSDVNMKNPKILRNGEECPTNICSKINYDGDLNTFSIEVKSFSNFTLIDNPSCGNGVCGSGETCSTCRSDCGVCVTVTTQEGAAAAEEEDDSGISTTSTPRCIPEWNCTWGNCTNSIRKTNCIDVKKCDSNLGKPSVVQENCTVGQNNLNTNENTTQNQENKKIPGIVYILGIIFVIAIILLIILMILFKKYKEEY